MNGSRFAAVHDSQFTAHDSRFMIRSSRLTVHDSQRERGVRQEMWDGGRERGR